MTERRVRRTFLVLMTVCLIAPIVLTLLHITKPGVILWGLAAAFVCSRALSLTSREFMRRQQELPAPGPNTSRTIYVDLVDKDGVLLPKEEQDRRMAEAYTQASPRDVIVPVKKRMREGR